MTEPTTKHGTTLTEQLDAKKDLSGEIIPPPQPQTAEILAAAPGEPLLPLSFTLKEIGATAACIVTSVRSGWIKNPSDLNIVNSVLRKIHDAKVQYVKNNP